MLTITNERGCGMRQEGGAYWTMELSPQGVPVAHFLRCPAFPLANEMEYSKQGWSLLPDPHRSDVTHFVDRISTRDYPNLADFIVELSVLGLSRRIPAQLLPYVSEHSRLILVHDRAIIDNWSDYGPMGMPCFKGLHERHDPQCSCLSLAFNDMVDLEERVESIYLRRLPCGWEYAGWPRPAGVTPLYTPGQFAVFPCAKVQVIAGVGAEEMYDRAKDSVKGIYVEVVES